MLLLMLSWLLPSGWTAVLQLGDGRCQVSNNFCLLLVCCDQLVNGGILLNGCFCQVVEQRCHLLFLDNFLGSSLIGKGQVAGGHAVDVAHLCKRGRPVHLPVVQCVIREGTVIGHGIMVGNIACSMSQFAKSPIADVRFDLKLKPDLRISKDLRSK
jgi:hypothetical protein